MCQDGELGCSQVVVAAQSPLLRLLLAGVGEEGEIFLPDFSLAAAQQVVATLHGLPPTVSTQLCNVGCGHRVSSAVSAEWWYQPSGQTDSGDSS